MNIREQDMTTRFYCHIAETADVSNLDRKKSQKSNESLMTIFSCPQRAVVLTLFRFAAPLLGKKIAAPFATI
jgi:hypothetical protein